MEDLALFSNIQPLLDTSPLPHTLSAITSIPQHPLPLSLVKSLYEPYYPTLPQEFSDIRTALPTLRHSTPSPLNQSDDSLLPPPSLLLTELHAQSTVILLSFARSLGFASAQSAVLLSADLTNSLYTYLSYVHSEKLDVRTAVYAEKGLDHSGLQDAMTQANFVLEEIKRINEGEIQSPDWTSVTEEIMNNALFVSTVGFLSPVPFIDNSLQKFASLASTEKIPHLCLGARLDSDFCTSLESAASSGRLDGALVPLSSLFGTASSSPYSLFISSHSSPKFEVFASSAGIAQPTVGIVDFFERIVAHPHPKFKLEQRENAHHALSDSIKKFCEVHQETLYHSTSSAFYLSLNTISQQTPMPESEVITEYLAQLQLNEQHRASSAKLPAVLPTPPQLPSLSPYLTKLEQTMHCCGFPVYLTHPQTDEDSSFAQSSSSPPSYIMVTCPIGMSVDTANAMMELLHVVYSSLVQLKQKTEQEMWEQFIRQVEESSTMNAEKQQKKKEENESKLLSFVERISSSQSDQYTWMLNDMSEYFSEPPQEDEEVDPNDLFGALEVNPEPEIIDDAVTPNTDVLMELVSSGYDMDEMIASSQPNLLTSKNKPVLTTKVNSTGVFAAIPTPSSFTDTDPAHPVRSFAPLALDLIPFNDNPKTVQSRPATSQLPQSQNPRAKPKQFYGAGKPVSKLASKPVGKTVAQTIRGSPKTLPSPKVKLTASSPKT
ncbi:hypothetical protein BLNAU_2251 [Blattamonas nauphoetae]|uniref:Uncharacterized protein n=1 Tax=Blattamonas nauphoetae TaxID=2049346 RepID=A0ABQ9YGD6_9EUKA|nr:hypothetical protein BLNAU_2251 [Blattamonas nauphoetae]